MIIQHLIHKTCYPPHINLINKNLKTQKAATCLSSDKKHCVLFTKIRNKSYFTEIIPIFTIHYINHHAWTIFFQLH